MFWMIPWYKNENWSVGAIQSRVQLSTRKNLLFIVVVAVHCEDSNSTEKGS